MTTITVPTREEVSVRNQALFDDLKKGLGMVPNLYATFALSETALATYLALQNAKSSISGKAREVVNLVVSQVNECEYCLAAHTMLGKLNGFTDEQIIEIRHGEASFDTKLDALTRLIKGITQSRVILIKPWSKHSLPQAGRRKTWWMPSSLLATKQ
ncbi:carboxymuconolactone decarboxylase family protein [Caballeronia sp. 15715]|uniref:carboxymuconolactone decarboxylase family protein n=1 Tax=unclassified Caballeronia TaxID=2646786 RepID=UPI0039E56739